MTPEARLHDLGLTLPEAGAPSHSYVRARQTGSLLYIAGHTPKRAGAYPFLGKVGGAVTLEQAQEAARICILNALASARQHLGTLERVTGVIKVVGYVASVPEFTRQPQVMNAASDLLIAVFGEAGRHARTSLGVAVLPEDVPVEIELILEVQA
ncbi:MAG: RidA family protein [Anaerolineae bacterium]|jgi:enamine deaminase RidA (YjgF/YER057c/UK114 family)|nr:RidA family protein [Anaerolineae bacterium]